VDAEDRPRGLLETVPLTAGLILDVIGDKIVHVEVLGGSDTRARRDQRLGFIWQDRHEA
jgi:hypothetical protein